MLKEIKDLIPKEFNNKWFVISAITVILSIIILKFDISKTLNVAFLFLVLLSLIIYKIKVEFPKGIDNFLFWCSFAIIVLISIAYISALTKEINITAITLIFSFLLMIIIPLTLHIRNLWKSKDMENKNITVVITSYLAVTFLIILLFSPLYQLSGIISGSGIIKTDKQIKLESKSEYIYFSALVFYSNVFGDFNANGYSRILVTLELTISFVWHIIILGMVTSNIKFSIDPQIKI